jgi:hypothetical protein
MDNQAIRAHDFRLRCNGKDAFCQLLLISLAAIGDSIILLYFLGRDVAEHGAYFGYPPIDIFFEQA